MSHYVQPIGDPDRAEKLFAEFCAAHERVRCPELYTVYRLGSRRLIRPVNGEKLDADSASGYWAESHPDTELHSCERAGVGPRLYTMYSSLP